ncbi:hypothetical protein [Haloquadratum walsbyi]|nr:hypothetical protein [Haloquadratum walsbyi]
MSLRDDRRVCIVSGYESLPERWLNTIEYREDLERLANVLVTADIDPRM